MAVIAVLVSMLLPAVQSARESARRTACANHLHQMGLALHSYHDLHHTVPPGGIEWRGGTDLSKRQIGWAAFLLPQLEQRSVYERIDWSKAFDSPENAPAAATVIDALLCPSTRREAPWVEGRGACDYGGIYGERISSPNDPPKGIMLYDRPVRIEDVTDGLSGTLILAEDSGWPEGQWINGRTIFDQAYAVNAAPNFENDIRSGHPGGAHGLLADGTVRFLDDSTSLALLAALCTRAGGEPVGEF
jgi:hypothetical protein